MPWKPRTPCRYPACPNLSKGPLCDKHRSHRSGGKRRSAHARGYGRRWRKARLEHLAEQPLCAECLKRGVVTAATDVDHIVPHRGDETLFWDRSNWQSLCDTHHSRKSMREMLEK